MIYPLKPTRVFRSYTGGKSLDRLEGKSPEISRFPEDWIGSVTKAINPGRDLPNEGLTQTADGRFLADVIAEDPSRMLGKHKEMSLLFKLLDSNERLVIQVHPTREFARTHFNSQFGKTECWYVLDDGGYVYLGFCEGVTKEHWKELFDTQDVDGMLSCLHRFDVKAGELIFVPGGVPHAIGEGCFVAELQEPTDLMVIPERVTPAGVLLPDRKLHGGLGFERMFDCFVYEGMSAEEVRRRYFRCPEARECGVTEIVGAELTDQFRLHRIDLTQALTLKNDSYGILLVLDGEGTVDRIDAKAGDRFFIPASEQQLELCGAMSLLWCRP